MESRSGLSGLQARRERRLKIAKPCAALRSVPCVCLCVIAKHKQVEEGRTRNDDDDECVWVHEPVDEAQEHLAANFVERIIVRDFMLVVVRVTLVRVHAAYAAARVHESELNVYTSKEGMS